MYTRKAHETREAPGAIQCGGVRPIRSKGRQDKMLLKRNLALHHGRSPLDASARGPNADREIFTPRWCAECAVRVNMRAVSGLRILAQQFEWLQADDLS